MNHRRRRNRNHKRDHKNNNNKLLINVLLAVLAILVIILAVVIGKVTKQSPVKPEESVITTEGTSEPQTEEQSSEEQSSEEESSLEEEEEIVYPEPEYDFTEEEVKVKVPGLKKNYRIAWVSDVHMITDKEASEDVMAEHMETINTRYETFKTADGMHGEELWPEIVKYLNYGKFDGIIFGGDIIDYCSKSNMDAFTEEYSKLNKKVPLMYIRADHDYGFWYGGEAFTEVDAHEAHTEIDGDRLEDKLLDFDEFTIIGVNGSTKNMTEPQYDIIHSLMKQNKPVIIATHVPYESKVDASLEELSMKVRNKVYYWGGGDYIPYEPTTKYFERVYSEDTVVEQILAGHLHAKWDGMITEQVPEHIFSPAFEGVIGIINIEPEE